MNCQVCSYKLVMFGAGEAPRSVKLLHSETESPVTRLRTLMTSLTHRFRTLFWQVEIGLGQAWDGTLSTIFIIFYIFVSDLLKRREVPVCHQGNSRILRITNIRFQQKLSSQNAVDEGVPATIFAANHVFLIGSRHRAVAFFLQVLTLCTDLNLTLCILISGTYSRFVWTNKMLAFASRSHVRAHVCRVKITFRLLLTNCLVFTKNECDGMLCKVDRAENASWLEQHPTIPWGGVNNRG